MAGRPETECDEASWLKLSPNAGETLRAALERTLREAILSGALREGVQLPPSRALAQTLGVSRGVVTDAYEQLEAQGFLVARPRVGTVVGAVPRPHHLGRERVADPRPAARLYDLTPTTPDVSLFPLGRWLATAQRVAREAGSALLDYRPPRGEPVLRAALADHLGRTRGVIADPEQIIVVQGTAQGAYLLLRVVLSRGGSRIAVEDPSHTSQHERIRELGFELVAQRVDEDGLVVEGLNADAALVTPAHQFPTGSVMSGERRRSLLAWSRETGGLIAEDDYDAEFRYDREPVRALQGLAPEHVVQLGTVSKTLAPALRLGWLLVPPDLADDAERAKRLLDDFSPALDQITLAELLASGHYDRHVRRARSVYRARRDRLLGELATQLPELSVGGVAAGVHLLLRLPSHVDDAQVAEAAARARIAVPSLSRYRLGHSDIRGLVIGYGRLHESAVKPAIRTLAGIVRPYL